MNDLMQITYTYKKTTDCFFVFSFPEVSHIFNISICERGYLFCHDKGNN